ncbi:DMT family transporter [Mesorhizobium sp. BAC0120]|uniref:DMT family transporter n=1 Tax=Mesorhizobium sp. BAC0120 TaxID=3090670 RepID=UPI00298CF5E2|nr:DMT family transporter [Mesorhizobium sp. BAC0120]MDW6021170.1 DMT family transporter [Mesorhizobium sp. BAC0120]
MHSGIFLALAAYAIYAWGDGIIKALGGHLSVFEIGFFNTLFASVFLFFLKPDGEKWRHFWVMQRPWAVQARAASGLAAGVLGVFAFTTIPLAETYALMFLAPLFVTLLSIIVLKEKVGPWRWLAVAMGFAGVLLVVRPGFRALEPGHFAAIVVAFLGATTIILMRSLAGERQTSMLATLVGYSLVFNGVAAAATSSFTMPSPKLLALLVLTGACTAAGHRLQLLATRITPANQIAPTHYSQMAWAVVIGAVFFAEYPDWISLVGLAVIGGAGMLTLVRERIRLGTVRWNPFSRNRL